MGARSVAAVGGAVMGSRQDASAALDALMAVQRAQSAICAVIFPTLGVNTITAQNITDLTAAVAAYDAGIRACVVACRPVAAPLS